MQQIQKREGAYKAGVRSSEAIVSACGCGIECVYYGKVVRVSLGGGDGKGADLEPSEITFARAAPRDSGT